MLLEPASRLVFLALAFTLQVLLILNFTARLLKPELELRYGVVVYLLGIPALVASAWFARQDEPWFITAAPLVLAVWAGFGFWIDRVAKIPWRRPRRLSVLVPYVTLLILAQFAFWIPLWYVGRLFWALFTIAYAINSILNLSSHRFANMAQT